MNVLRGLFYSVLLLAPGLALADPVSAGILIAAQVAANALPAFAIYFTAIGTVTATAFGRIHHGKTEAPK